MMTETDLEPGDRLTGTFEPWGLGGGKGGVGLDVRFRIG